MTKNTNETTEAILRLKEKMAAEPKRKGGGLFRASVELRSEVVELWKSSGQTRVAIAKQLGIDPKSMTNWARAELVRTKPKRKYTRRKKKVAATSGFKRVVVRADKEPDDFGRKATARAAGSLELELGGGAKITGLTLDDVARLLAGGAR